MSSELADVGLAAFQKVAAIWQAGRHDSLIEFTRPTRVEPIVLVDAAAVHLPALPEIMQSLLSLYTGYYLQAVALMAQVGNVQVIKQLDKLSPNRDVGDAVLTLVAESYRDRLPKANAVVSQERRIAIESSLTGPEKNSASTVKELSNLAVGKLINVEISDGGQNKAVVPVNVRIVPSELPTKSLVHILTVDSQDKSMSERWHGIRSGRLRTIADGFLCMDLIQAHRKNLMADRDGAYTAISRRANSNALTTMLTMNPSVATASNMVVMTEGTARELELQMSGKLSNFQAREKMLSNTTVMIIAVIDPHYDRVTFYHRSIPQPTEVGVRDLKISNKSGPDVGDILKAFQIGNSPSL